MRNGWPMAGRKNQFKDLGFNLIMSVLYLWLFSAKQKKPKGNSIAKKMFFFHV